MHDVLLTPQAERDLKRLPAETFHRVIVEIQTLAQTPRPSGCRKLSGSRNDYRVRVGDYRILYEVNDSGQEVRILRVRHRREAYR
jgi:mRNA interferase RelE/StbE